MIDSFFVKFGKSREIPVREIPGERRQLLCFGVHFEGLEEMDELCPPDGTQRPSIIVPMGALGAVEAEREGWLFVKNYHDFGPEWLCPNCAGKYKMEQNVQNVTLVT